LRRIGASRKNSIRIEVGVKPEMELEKVEANWRVGGMASGMKTGETSAAYGLV
jgi:hypothetical protein